MANGARWSIALLVLVVAGIIAIWPRSGSDDVSASAAARGSSPTALPPEDDADLTPLRKRAALRPCPSPDPGTGRSSGPLAGVSAWCLGAPGVVDLGAALAGKATLVNLWASWCVPCREEMPVLATYAERPGSIPVLGVNVKERASAGLAFMAEIGVHYPSLYEGDAEGEETVQQVLRTPPVLPVNYLVRPDGTVERITDPLVFHSPDEIRATVDRLLSR